MKWDRVSRLSSAEDFPLFHVQMLIVAAAAVRRLQPFLQDRHFMQMRKGVNITEARRQLD